MYAPITWTNTAESGRALAAGAVPLHYATESVNNAFTGFSNVIKGLEATNRDNWKVGQDNNTAAFMRLVDQSRNATEFEQNRNALLAAQQGYGNQIDQAAARQAVDNRLAILQGRDIKSNEYTRSQDTFTAAPILDKAALAAVRGDTAALTTLQEQNPNVRGLAEYFPKAQAGALAAVKGPQELAAAKLVTELFPQVSANQRLETKIASERLPLQAQAVQNETEDLLVQQLSSAAAQAHQESQRAGRLALAPHAVKLGFDLDSGGAPDIQNMTPAQRNQLDSAALKDKNITKTTKDLYQGDTKVANSFLSDTLRKDPRISAAGITRNQAKIMGAFDTSRNGAPVGNDSVLLDRKMAETEVRIKEQNARNRFAPGSPDALSTYEDLATKIPGIVPQDAQEDVPELQKMLARFSTQGVEVKPGVFVTPSAQDIMGEIRGYVPTEFGNFRNARQAEDIEANLKKTLAGVDVAELLKQREEAMRFNRQKGVRDILNPIMPSMFPINPLGLPPVDPKKK